MRIRSTLTAAGAAIALTGAALAVAAPANAATLSAAAGTASASARHCDLSSWSGDVDGTPAAFTADTASGVSLWHTSSGFHLRVTHPGSSRRVYTGVITADAPMRASGYRLEKGDVVTLSKDRRTLAFAFVDYGRIDGANVTTDCATSLTLSRLHVGNRALPATSVYLGADRSHPSALPVTFTRSTATTPTTTPQAG